MLKVNHYKIPSCEHWAPHAACPVYDPASFKGKSLDETPTHAVAVLAFAAERVKCKSIEKIPTNVH